MKLEDDMDWSLCSHVSWKQV